MIQMTHLLKDINVFLNLQINIENELLFLKKKEL